MAKSKTLTVELKKSPHGVLQNQKATLTGLGLRKIGDKRALEDTPAVRGMVRVVQHMVAVS